MYFNVNFNACFFKLIKVHLLVSELYVLRVCVCSLSYPECNAHAPYCNPWPIQFYNIFPLSHTWQDFL